MLPGGISTARHQDQRPPSAFSFSSTHPLGVAEEQPGPKTGVHVVLHSGPGPTPACRTGSGYSDDWEGSTAKNVRYQKVVNGEGQWPVRGRDQ